MSLDEQENLFLIRELGVFVSFPENGPSAPQAGVMDQRRISHKTRS
jgi:hypothetical protein